MAFDFFNDVLTSGYLSNIFEGKDVITFLDSKVKGTSFYQAIEAYCKSIVLAAVFTWGVYYFIKAYWDMVRELQSWDEIFVFIVRKSIPVLLVFLLVLPVNLPSLNTGGTPFALYLFNEGAEGAFKVIPKKIFGNVPIEALPLYLVQRSAQDAWDKVNKMIAADKIEIIDSTPQEVHEVSDSISLNPLELFASFGKVLRNLGRLIIAVLFKFGFIILLLAIYFVFLAQLIVLKLKFILFAPLFFLSVVFLLIDRYSNIFYENLKALFAWMLQPVFLVAATYAALIMGIYVLLLFIDDSFISRMLTRFFEESLSGAPTVEVEGIPLVSPEWWRGVLKNFLIQIVYIIALIVLACYYFKMAWSVPETVVKNVMRGLEQVVSAAFRSID